MLAIEFELAALQLALRGCDLEVLNLLRHDQLDAGDAARQIAVCRPIAAFLVGQRVVAGGVATGELELECADPLTLERERMHPRQRRVPGAVAERPAALAGDRAPAVRRDRPGRCLGDDRFLGGVFCEVETGPLQLIAARARASAPMAAP